MAANRARLSLAELGEFDDLLTDALVDKVRLHWPLFSCTGVPKGEFATIWGPVSKMRRNYRFTTGRKYGRRNDFTYQIGGLQRRMSRL